MVYTTLIIWTNLHPYPNLRKTEKIKSTVRILKKDFCSVYFIHQSWWCKKSKKSVYSKVMTDYCSPIIVSKCFLHPVHKNWYKFYSLILKVKWINSLQYLFYSLYYIWQIYDSCSRSNTYGAKLSLRIVNI